MQSAELRKKIVPIFDFVKINTPINRSLKGFNVFHRDGLRAAQYNLGRGGPCVLPRRQIRIFSREEQAPPLPNEWVITPINRSLAAPAAAKNRAA